MIQLIQKQRSDISKVSLVQWNENVLWTNKKNQLVSTIINTQSSPSSQPSPILRGNKICISSFDTAHRKFGITPEEKIVSMNSDPINSNKQVHNQLFFGQNWKPKQKCFKVNKRM